MNRTASSSSVQDSDSPGSNGQGDAPSGAMTFWDHLDVLRSALIRMAVAVVVAAVVAFLLKDVLFSVVLAPRSSDFVSYRLIGVEAFSLHLMNTGLTEQFMIHVRTAMYAGLLVASPYILYELFHFVSPGLYQNERHYAVWIVGAAYLMFLLGTLVNYFVAFPLTVRFLGTYQVSPDVANMLTLQSYVDTLLGMSLVMGVVFEWHADRIPPACRGGYTYRGGHHHPDDGRVHADGGGTAHLPALRDKYSNRQTN